MPAKREKRESLGVTGASRRYYIRTTVHARARGESSMATVSQHFDFECRTNFTSLFCTLLSSRCPPSCCSLIKYAVFGNAIFPLPVPDFPQHRPHDFRTLTEI